MLGKPREVACGLTGLCGLWWTWTRSPGCWSRACSLLVLSSLLFFSSCARVCSPNYCVSVGYLPLGWLACDSSRVFFNSLFLEMVFSGTGQQLIALWCKWCDFTMKKAIQFGCRLLARFGALDNSELRKRIF